jgi:hypothetical protein
MDTAGVHLHLFVELYKFYIYIYICSDLAIADCDDSDDDNVKYIAVYQFKYFCIIYINTLKIMHR